MTRKSLLPQTRHHIQVYDEDWLWLVAAYGDNSESRLGPGPAVRQLVHKFVLGQKAKEQGLLNQEQRTVEPTE